MGGRAGWSLLIKSRRVATNDVAAGPLSVQGDGGCSSLRRVWLVLLLLWWATPLAAEDSGLRLVEAARTQVGVTTGYDGRYQRLDYPGGDVPVETGVCTDVLVRALRVLGIDLQVQVHEDMRVAFAAYPAHWGLAGPDRNIDHRRVPNLETFLARRGSTLPLSDHASDYRPGEIVSWRLDSGLPHIGIVSDRVAQGRPMIIHNIGAGVREEDVLFAWRMHGRYRLLPE
jgi:uncharacterized protein